jgi:hypothetical protein
MARAFENNPEYFGPTKEMMKFLKNAGEGREKRKEDMKEIFKEIKEDPAKSIFSNPEKKPAPTFRDNKEGKIRYFTPPSSTTYTPEKRI